LREEEKGTSLRGFAVNQGGAREGPPVRIAGGGSGVLVRNQEFPVSHEAAVFRERRFGRGAFFYDGGNVLTPSEPDFSVRFIRCQSRNLTGSQSAFFFVYPCVFDELLERM